MGCDIHCYKETFVDGRWVTADNWKTTDYGDGESHTDVPWEDRFTTRNYQLFGVLAAGVRGYEYDYSFQQRGLPFDMSAECAAQAESWDSDGHSHSYLYLHELKALREHIKTATVHIEGMKNRDEIKALNASIASGTPNWELIFPYCKWGGDPTYEDFKVDVPAAFYLGESLDELIKGFDGLDGENHRLVFFFDN